MMLVSKLDKKLKEDGIPMEYEADTYYATITEQFKRVDGESSYYTRLTGNGQFTIELNFNRLDGDESKENAKKLVEERLEPSIPDLDTFDVVQTDYGWKYERFVKTSDEDMTVFEIVKEGEHTDHEVFDIYVFYIREEWDTYSKLS